MSKKGKRFFAIPTGTFGRKIKNTPAVVSNNNATLTSSVAKRQLIEDQSVNSTSDLVQSFNSRVDKVESSVNSRVDKVESSVNSRVDKVESSVNSRADKVESSLQSVNRTLEAYKTQSQEVNNNVTSLKSQLQSIKEERKTLAISIPATVMTKVNCSVPTSSSLNHYKEKGMTEDHRIWSHELKNKDDIVQCTIPIPTSYPNSAVAEINFYTKEQSGICGLELATTSNNTVETNKVSSDMEVDKNNNYTLLVPLPSNVCGNYHINIKATGILPIYITGMCLVF